MVHVMVNFHCPLDCIWGHSGDNTLLVILMSVFPLTDIFNWGRKTHSECAWYFPVFWNPRLHRKEQKEGACRAHHWSLCFLTVAFSVLPPQLECVASRVLQLPLFMYKYNLLNPHNVTCICIISGLTTGIGYSMGQGAFLWWRFFFLTHTIL